MPLKPSPSRGGLPAATLGLLLAVAGPAHSGPSAPGPTVRLDPFVAAAAPLPPSASLMGDGLESTRAFTTVFRGQIDAYGTGTVGDLSLFTPGATNVPPYGLTGVPTLRGDLGDSAQNGQRRAWNRNVFPVSLNSVESAEILAGAAPATLGFTNGTGGLVNFVTKRPAFERRTILATSLSSWDDFRAQLDTTGPLAPGLAGRLSLEHAEAGSFFRLLDSRSTDIYLALTWLPGAGTRWDFSAEFYDAEFAENPGINRPTQALVDRGEYITGSSVQGGGAGPYFGNTFTPTGTVTLDGSQVLLAPGDGGSARAWTAQLVGTFMPDADRTAVNRTWFESVTAEKYSAYTFYSYLPRNLTVENRTEFRETRGWGGVVHDLLYGISLRAEERTSFVDFFNEAMNAFDLTLDPDTFRFPVARLFGIRPVPGRPGRFAVSGARYDAFPTTSLSQTLHSRMLNAGLFAQDTIPVTPSISLLLAARADAIHVDSQDPLPAPGFAPVGDSLKKVMPSVTASFRWEPRRSLSTYVTFHQAAAVEPSSSSGGYGLTANRIPAALFENTSTLIEAGIQATSAEGTVDGGLAVFRQERTRTNPRLGRPDEILVRGVEARGAWQVTPRLALTANGSFLDARYRDGPLPGSIATVPRFDPAIPSGGFGAFVAGDHRLPGIPRWSANLFATYSGPAWGARAWGSVQGPQNLDLFGHVVIPAQQTWNAGVYWQRARWEFSCDVHNLTDKFNWRPTSTPFAGADLVTRELPRRWRCTVRRAF